MSNGFTESVVKDAAFAWLESTGYAVRHGPDKSPYGDTLTLSQKEREFLAVVPSPTIFPVGWGKLFGVVARIRAPQSYLI